MHCKKHCRQPVFTARENGDVFGPCSFPAFPLQMFLLCWSYFFLGIFTSSAAILGVGWFFPLMLTLSIGGFLSQFKQVSEFLMRSNPAPKWSPYFICCPWIWGSDMAKKKKKRENVTLNKSLFCLVESETLLKACCRKSSLNSGDFNWDNYKTLIWLIRHLTRLQNMWYFIYFEDMYFSLHINRYCCDFVWW